MRVRFAAPLAFVLLLAPAATLAQRVTVSGFVRDAETGETLLSANVAVAGTTQGTVTNTSGFYALSLPAGPATLVVSYVGYATVERRLVLARDTTLNVDLAPEGTELSEVEVTGDREREQETRRVGVAELPVATIRQLPSVLEPDVFRSLQLLPGIKAASDFSSGLYIRGGSPDQTLILLDRTTVYNPTHFFGLFSTFNPDAIKDVRVYKGGYPAEYGGRLGSVLDIYNKDGNRRRFDGSASVGILASRALVEGPVAGRGSFMLAARRSTLEPLLAVLRDAEVDGIPEAFYFYDLNGKFNLDLSPKNLVSASFYAGRDYVDVPFLDDASINLRYGNATGSLNWTHLFTPRVFSAFTFTGSRYYSNPIFRVSNTEFERPGTITDLSAKGDLQWQPSNRHTLKAGFWGGALDFRLRRVFDGETNFSPRIQAGYAQAYVQERFTPTTRWLFEGGLRGTYFTDGGFFRLEPRATVEYRPADAVRLQTGYGRYYQYLSLVTSEVFTGADFWLTAADGVPPSYGDQYVAGVKLDLGRRVDLDVDGYYRTMRDLFELDPFIQDPAGLDYPENFRFGRGYAYGVEVLLSARVGPFEGFSGYTFGVTRRRFPAFESGYYPPKYDRTHDANLVLNTTLGRGWKATTVFTYATGQAYTEPTGQYVLFGSPFQGTIPVLRTEFNGFRLPSYHRLDVGLTKTGRFFSFAEYELQLQAINAYGRDNAWFYFFSRDANSGAFERNRVNQIPIPLPNVALTLHF